MSGTILTEKKGNYAIITINRPDALNALNKDVLVELKDAVQDVTRDAGMRLLILTGSGEKAFVAGADIKQMQNLGTKEAEEFGRLGHDTMNAISRADLISIAAINGFALGGGLELALACDIRLASSKAKLGLPEVGLGLIPGFGGTQRLPRIVGRGLALEIILSAGMIDAERAERIGLVNHVYEPGELLPKSIEFAEKLLGTNGPNAQKMARWLVHSGMDQPLAAALEREINSFADLFSGNESSEGMSAFVDKRKPDFK